MNPPVNTFDPASLLPNLRAFLVTAGICRVPAVAAPDDNPNLAPMWLDPKRGIPYPGQSEGLQEAEVGPQMVLAAYPETGIPSIAHEGFYVRKPASIWYRCISSPPIQSLHEQIRALLHDQRNYSLNGLQVNQSLFSRECQRVTSNEEGFIYNCEIMFELWSDDTVLAD